MVKKNIKSYLLLSVTIIMSFSFLLGFFVFIDSEIYNKHKITFSISPKVVVLIGPTDIKSNLNETNNNFNLLIHQLEKMDDTDFYMFYEKQFQLNHYQSGNLIINSNVYYIPNNTQGFYENHDGSGFISTRYLKGSKVIESSNQAIIDENLYNLLRAQGKNTDESVKITIPVAEENGGTVLKEFQVVGVVSAFAGYYTANDSRSLDSHIFLSQDLIKNTDSDIKQSRILVFSDRVSEVVSICDILNIEYFYPPYMIQRQALSEIQNQVFIKGITSIILFFLLAINLYSSFKNALNDRKFEIGVKRAIGAGKKDIVYQFFIEGMIVMVSSIIVSAIIILNLSLIYKLIQRVAFGVQWTIYLSSYSVIMFLFSAFFLSVSFSLIFAFQSTQIEIVKHLKQE
ncbi:MAG: FtsX-like permease family protein [Eubacteriales bacterium]|nr:FtsX-like permease family protein [Eubacteriales bacterium]MDD4475406.1 FtsX-like permease family protein [Eubacteriales bacterium]